MFKISGEEEGLVSVKKMVCVKKVYSGRSGWGV